MSRRNRPTSAPVTDAVPETTPTPTATPILLTDHLTVKRAENQSDLRLKEAVHAAMRRICALTSGFIAEKQAEGFSIDEILQLYEVVAPVAPTVTEEDGRIKVNWDVTIVERVEGDAA
jgi:hypothetical protein